MASAGQLKPPVVPLAEMHRRAVRLIGMHDTGCALFIIAGTLQGCSRGSQAFDRRTTVNASNLVGVYDFDVDLDRVREDLGEFYGRQA